jgi:beta-phosphoglucomutase-like phosphatase (HAD superfamily)
MTLAELVSQIRGLLVDFDGPVCSVFAGHSAYGVADELHSIIRARLGGELPPGIVKSASDPLQVLREVEALGDEEMTRAVADACRDAEVTAVATATPTLGAETLVHAAQRTGRQVAIVSNNARLAVETYLRAHDLVGYVDSIAARFDSMSPRLLKPHPFLVRRGLEAINAEPTEAVFIGDSVADIVAGRAAGTVTIGYANKPGKQARLANAGADVVVDTMESIVEVLTPVKGGQPR